MHRFIALYLSVLCPHPSVQYRPAVMYAHHVLTTNLCADRATRPWCYGKCNWPFIQRMSLPTKSVLNEHNFAVFRSTSRSASAPYTVRCSSSSNELHVTNYSTVNQALETALNTEDSSYLALELHRVYAVLQNLRTV